MNHRPLGYEPNRINDSISFQRLDGAGNDTKSLKRPQNTVIGPQSDHTPGTISRVLNAAFSGASETVLANNLQGRRRLRSPCNDAQGLIETHSVMEIPLNFQKPRGAWAGTACEASARLRTILFCRARMKVVPEVAAGSSYRDQHRRQSGNNFAANAAKSSVGSPDSSSALARSIPRMAARVPARAFTAAASARPLAAA